jgi:hypothetical protein
MASPWDALASAVFRFPLSSVADVRRKLRQDRCGEQTILSMTKTVLDLMRKSMRPADYGIEQQQTGSRSRRRAPLYGPQVPGPTPPEPGPAVPSTWMPAPCLHAPSVVPRARPDDEQRPQCGPSAAQPRIRQVRTRQHRAHLRTDQRGALEPGLGAARREGTCIGLSTVRYAVHGFAASTPGQAGRSGNCRAEPPGWTACRSPLAVTAVPMSR